jgi:NAD(P)-dependent dehydrogenase (short-subunit alcohol dehydrogenase family)
VATQRLLVIGGSSGIGAATAMRFAQAGAEVVITGRNEERLRDVAGRIGPGAIAHRLDAASPAELAAFFAADTRYDHLVLALSGASGGGTFPDLDLNTLRAGFEGKFWLHLQTLQAALPRLRAGGSVTFITASSARSALPGTAGLAAINGALEAMVGPLAVELAPLRVNAVSPGVIDTPWWDGVSAEQRTELFRSYEKGSPVGRVGQPEDVAQAVLLLATNGFMTGTVLECAGGTTLATGR